MITERNRAFMLVLAFGLFLPLPVLAQTGATAPQATFTASPIGYNIQGRCRRAGGPVICELTIVNQGATQNVFLTHATVYDKNSKAYRSSTVSLAGVQTGAARIWVRATLVQNLDANGNFAGHYPTGKNYTHPEYTPISRCADWSCREQSAAALAAHRSAP